MKLRLMRSHPRPPTDVALEPLPEAGLVDQGGSRGDQNPPAADMTQSHRGAASPQPAAASRRSLREQFHARPRQLLTAQPRLVSAVYLDSEWTQALSSTPIHVLATPQRWMCSRCTVVQQAFAIDAANRIQWKRSGDEFFVHQGPPEVVHDQTMDGSTGGENFCCGWNLLSGGSSSGSHRPSSSSSSRHHGASDQVMRAFGCDWTPHGTLMCIILSDILTLGLPCGPLGYLGCGSLWFGLQTRLLIRRKYRINGFGIEDLCTVFCCPQCAVEQQLTEMVRQGVLVSSPSPCDMC